jgi:hypothetical protein
MMDKEVFEGVDCSTRGMNIRSNSDITSYTPCSLMESMESRRF